MYYNLYFEMRQTNADRLSDPDKGGRLSTPDSAHKPQDPLQFISLTDFSMALATKLSYCKSKHHWFPLHTLFKKKKQQTKQTKTNKTNQKGQTLKPCTSALIHLPIFLYSAAFQVTHC